MIKRSFLKFIRKFCFSKTERLKLLIDLHLKLAKRYKNIFDISILRVYEADNKVRLGKLNDGGYIIIDKLSYDVFISGGIAKDISFETAFLDNNKVPAFAFDGQIENLPKNNASIQFESKNISNTTTKKTVNLHTLLSKYSNAFVKMDIEGSEFEWLASLKPSHIRNIKQLVIEFHFPFTLTRWGTLKRLTKTHYLVHFHPNNCCRLVKVGNILVPRVFECTFVRKDQLNSPELSKESIPTSLDSPNLTDRKEIQLNTYPYVHK